MSRADIARLLAAPQEWDRRRLQVLLGLGVLVLAGVAIGIIWSVQSLLGGDHGTTQDSAHDTPGRGAIANTRPPASPLEAAQPGPLSTETTGTITLPQAARLGEAQVATGFPHTTQGALAQLVAIDQRALQSASVVTAQDVIRAWAAPGGPTPHTWSGVQAVAILLSEAGLPANAMTGLQVELSPAMGLIRGTSGNDVVVACVDFVLTVTVTVTSGAAPASRIAVADCQRMAWRAGRWLIGPGKEPASSASLWPGTPASYDAGYQWLEVSP